MDNYKKRLENAVKNLQQCTDIIDVNKEHIIGILNQLSAENLSLRRQLKYLYTLKPIAKGINKDFSLFDKKDIVALLKKINTSGKAENTKKDFRVILKIFFRWLREQDGESFEKGEYPEEVKWINTAIKRNKTRLPNELLTIEDVNNLANNTNNLRDRCLIYLLYESGARIGELLGVRLKDIDFDEHGARITISGKTGTRKIRVISSSPSISNWLLEHPDKNNKNALLFCGIWGYKRGKDISYNTISKILKETAKRAKINKPQNPHHYRHSRGTELAKNLTEAELCTYMGWVQGSREASTYVHLSGRDTDRAILKMYGLVEEDKDNDKFKAIQCPRCKINNDPGSKFCGSCNLGLDVKSIMEFDKQKEMAVGEVEKLKKQMDEITKQNTKINEEMIEMRGIFQMKQTGWYDMLPDEMKKMYTDHELWISYTFDGPPRKNP
jgi:integrase